MMRHSCLFVLISLGLLSNILAQETITNGGEHFEKAEGSISWTLGQLSHETLGSEDFILSQGFHQPTVIISSIVDLPQLKLKLRAFPNPTTQRMQLEFTEGFRSETFRAQLIDQFGRLYLEQALNDPLTDLDFSKLSSGVYLIRIQGNGRAVHTFKVIKQ